MCCEKCGKEIQDDSKVCPSCGMTVGHSASMTKLVKKGENSYRFDRIRALHVASIINAAIIVLLTFSKWLRIDVPVIGGNYSPLGLYMGEGELFRYVDGNAFKGFSVFLIIITSFVALLVITYILIAFLNRHDCDNSNIIRNGKSLMLAIAIMYAICAGIATTLETSQDGYKILQISFNKYFYAIIVLSCVNRFLILPWYDKLLSDRLCKDNMSEHNSKLTQLAEK